MNYAHVEELGEGYFTILLCSSIITVRGVALGDPPPY
jgi:hypothetical protein